MSVALVAGPRTGVDPEVVGLAVRRGVTTKAWGAAVMGRAGRGERGDGAGNADVVPGAAADVGGPDRRAGGYRCDMCRGAGAALGARRGEKIGRAKRVRPCAA